MIPIKNKKKTLEVTVDEMKNFSFAYIEKYAPSKQQLRTYLLKKYIKLNSLQINKIRNYLYSKGIRDKYIKETIDKIKEDNEDQDFFSAIKICKKKRIGPSRNENNRELFYKKDIGILARSGFDFETSKKVMDLDQEDYKRIINLL